MHSRKQSWPLETVDTRRKEYSKTPTNEEEDSLNIATFKIFLHKKLQSASSLIMKPRTHTCKVKVVTDEDSMELVVSDGTFLNEGLVFLRGELGQDKEKRGTLFRGDNILELGFEFDLPYDINSTSMLKEILALKNLQSLTLKTNYIPNFPTEIAQMKQLKSLSLANNQIKSLSTEISSLKLLTSLNLSNNQLTALPKELVHLHRLLHLNLSYNFLNTLPASLHGLQCLKTLNFGNNRLGVLPDMSALTVLEELDLSNNMLTHAEPFSDSIIDKMKTIATGSSNMRTLSYLTNLKSICLKSNRLVSTLDFVLSLPHLTNCDLSYNSIQQINTLPSSTLVALDISHNLLSSVQTTITQLQALKELNLSNNALTSIPAELGQMNALETLNLSCNQLKSDFLHLTWLTQLKSLNLANNGISNLPFTIGKLQQLQYLNLSRNLLKILPSSIGALIELRRLDISRNKLGSIPYTIKQLSNLQALRMHANRFTVLPMEATQLTSLVELSVHNIYISDNGNLSIIHKNEDSEKAAPSLRVFDVISLARSSPHILLIYSLYLMSEEAYYQDKIASEGGIADALYWISHSKGRTQIDATKILANLSIKHQDLVFEEGGVDVIKQLLLDPTAEVESKVHALVVLGNISLSDSNRKCMLEMLDLRDIIIRLSNDENCDLRIKKNSKKTLAILGITDTIPGDRGIRILTMDGGGARGVTTVEILKKMEQVTGKKIEEMFDLIGGTSAGALSAVCMGMKKLPLEKVSNLQDKMCYEIFAHGIAPVAVEEYGIFSHHWARLQSRFSGATQMLRSGTFYSAKAVEEVFQSVVGDEKLIDTAMEGNVKVFLVSTLTNCFPPQIYLWRNYQYPNGTKSRYMGSMTHRIWEAMRASTAAPSYFDEFVSGNDRHQDGGCIANNPTAIAIHEAKCLWPNRKVDCIVSIGTGSVPLRENKGSYLERTIVEFIECATSVDRIHDLMEDSFPSNIYFRFNPIDERYSCDLDESHPEKLDAMREAARNYVDQNTERFQELAALLS